MHRSKLAWLHDNVKIYDSSQRIEILFSNVTTNVGGKESYHLFSSLRVFSVEAFDSGFYGCCLLNESSSELLDTKFILLM